MSLLKRRMPMYAGGAMGLILLATGAAWWLFTEEDAQRKGEARRMHKAVINLFLQSEYDTSTARSQSCQIPLFASVHRLQNRLVAAGTGPIRKWRTDRDEWVYTTDFQNFGELGSDGLPNNLTFCLESPSPDYIQTLKVNLNIHNEARRDDALRKYTETVEKVLGAIDILMPADLKAALLSGRAFELDTGNWIGKNGVRRGNIESWEFAITSH